MSAIIVFAPAIIAGWPAITAAVAGAAAALGLAVAQGVEEKIEDTVENSVEVAVENSELLAEGMATGEQMVLTKGDVVIRVFRDERGQCRVCVTGKGHANDELKALGEEVVQKVTQMFVYNRLMIGMRAKGFTVIQEAIDEDDSVRIHVRRQVG